MSPKNRFENSGFNEEEPEKIEVSQWDEWKLVEGGQLAETTGLGPCFGVVIYDPETKRALVGHFTDPRVNDFEGMLAEAKKLFNDLTKVKVCVGGGAPDPDDAPDFTDDKKKRKFVKDKLTENGFQNPKIDYQNSMDTTVLRVDTRNGNIEYDTESDWEDED